MNKYEEALGFLLIGPADCYGDKTLTERYEIIKNIKLLKELVERATPKKVVKMRADSEYASCPGCRQSVNCLEEFCHCCGQKLDWSKEDGKYALKELEM